MSNTSMIQDPTSTLSDPSANTLNTRLLIIFSIISILALIPPFRAFYRLSNLPACSICISLSIGTFFSFLNALLWPTDDFSTWWPGYGLCDIQSTVGWPLKVVTVTGLVGLLRGLAMALDTERVNLMPSRQQKGRKLWIEIGIVWGLPVLVLGTQWLIQIGRYHIVPVSGCGMEMDVSWVYVVIMIVPAPVCTFVACSYAILLLIRLHKHRQTITQTLLLTNPSSSIPPNKFLKLTLIALLILLIYFPMATYSTYSFFPLYNIGPYNFTAIHDPKYWGMVTYYHTQDDPMSQYYTWGDIAYGLILLPFFGWTRDAKREYRECCVGLGLGRLFPCLLKTTQEKGHRGTGHSSMGSSAVSNRSGIKSEKTGMVTRVRDFMHIGNGSGSALDRKESKNLSVTSRTFSDRSTLEFPKRTSPLSFETLTTSPLPHSHPYLPTTTTTTTTTITATTTNRNTPSNPLPLSRFATIRNFNPLLLFALPSRSTTTATTTLEAPPTIPPPTPPPAAHLSSKDLDLDMDIEAMDPHAPPMGSRAYRELQRRERERDLKDLEAGKF